MKEKKINKTKVWPKGYTATDVNIQDFDVRNDLIGNILKESPKKKYNTELFTVMAKRRSTRKFSPNPVEKWKIDKILAAADTAPTAGNCQGFEIFYVTENKMKEKLAIAANNQPYVNTPLLLVFCMNPARINLDFSKIFVLLFCGHPVVDESIRYLLINIGSRQCLVRRKFTYIISNLELNSSRSACSY